MPESGFEMLAFLLLARLTALGSQHQNSVTYCSNCTPFVASYATMAANNLRMHLFLLVQCCAACTGLCALLAGPPCGHCVLLAGPCLCALRAPV